MDYTYSRELEYLNVLTMYLTSMPVWDDYAVHFHLLTELIFAWQVKRKGVDRGVGGESGEFSLMLVVAPVVAGMAFVSLVGIFIFISMAR